MHGRSILRELRRRFSGEIRELKFLDRPVAIEGKADRVAGAVAFSPADVCPIPLASPVVTVASGSVGNSTSLPSIGPPAVFATILKW